VVRNLCKCRALTGEPHRFVNETRGLSRWFVTYTFRPERPEGRVAVAFQGNVDG
jgi:hypothetical protein